MSEATISDWTVTEASKALQKKKESVVIEQLSELVSRGLIRIEEREPVIIEENGKIRITQKVKLVSRHQEYITELENEIEVLRDQVNRLKDQLFRVETAV